jgi:hypothetical protein
MRSLEFCAGDGSSDPESLVVVGGKLVSSRHERPGLTIRFGENNVSFSVTEMDVIFL